MALARLTKQCHECPFVETCEHKEMEALGYLPEPIMADVKVPVTADIAAPILRETVSRVVDGKVVTHMAKELGDVAWYLAVSANAIGYDLETIMQMNVDKLKARYPDGFDAEHSLHRNQDDI